MKDTGHQYITSGEIKGDTAHYGAPATLYTADGTLIAFTEYYFPDRPTKGYEGPLAYTVYRLTPA